LIGRLTGRIAEEGADGTVIVDVGGVGYEVVAPLGTSDRAKPDAAGCATIYIHTHVREDALLLYGFASRSERAAFRELIGVSNVGPKLAVSILGVLSVSDLASAVITGNLRALTRVPGVGKKTAERLALELKDKLSSHGPPPTAAAVEGNASIGGRPGELLHGALTRMGYKPAEADRAVLALRDRIATVALADLVREALALLSS
jgi:Holliday junction DNA helicase RuvA